jgi:hypothetical protein
MKSHRSHGLGDHATGHAHSDIARNGAPKRVTDIHFHPGMKTQTKSGAVALGGNHASAIDSLTGQAVIPGAVKSTPGFGNAGVSNGSPIAKPPGAKVLKPVTPSWGDHGRTNRGSHEQDLGAAVLSEALRSK